MKLQNPNHLLAICAATVTSLAFTHANMVDGVYKFDLLEVGELDGQDGWTPTAMYSRDGKLFVVTADQDSDSRAVTGTPGKTKYYFRKLRPEDGIPPFNNEDRILALQFDIQSGPYSGTFFVGGEGTGIALIWDEKINVRANGITGKMPLLTTSKPPNIPDGTWVTIRAEINNQNASLLWKVRDDENADFEPFPDAEDFDVGNLLQNADSWDRIGVAIGRSGTMQINNLVPNAAVLQQDIPDEYEND